MVSVLTLPARAAVSLGKEPVAEVAREGELRLL